MGTPWVFGPALPNVLCLTNWVLHSITQVEVAAIAQMHTHAHALNFTPYKMSTKQSNDPYTKSYVNTSSNRRHVAQDGALGLQNPRDVFLSRQLI